MANHALATATNPSSDLTDFTLIVDLSDMPANWWSAVDTSDGTKGRVYKGDGSTRLACDWIDFDDTGEAGLLRVKWAGDLLTTGTQQLWIEPPISTNASVGASDTYGSNNAYDSATWGYWPLHDGNDRTLNGRDLTAVGGLSFGGQTGLIGDATIFDDASNEWCVVAGDSFDFTDPCSIHTLIKVDDTSQDNGIIGAVDNNTTQHYLQLWYDNAVPDRIGIYNRTAQYGSTNPGTDWTGVGFSSKGSYNVDLFVNGSNEASHSNGFSYDTYDLAIGVCGEDPYIKRFSGYQQHVYASTVQRSAAWFDQEHAQLSDNSTFWGTWTWVAAGSTYYQSNSGSMPAAVGSLSTNTIFNQLLAGDTPAAQALLIKHTLISLIGDMPAPVGDQVKLISKDLVGDAPSQGGSINASLTFASNVEGEMPAAEGDVDTSILNLVQNIFGNMPSAVGSIIKKIGKFLTGDTPEPSGGTTKKTITSVSGEMPDPSGYVDGGLRTSYSIFGNMPFPTGSLSTLLNPVAVIGKLAKIIGSSMKKLIGG